MATKLVVTENTKQSIEDLTQAVQDAVCIVKRGTAKRVDVAGGLIVYKCPNVIRIDLKTKEVDDEQSVR